MGSEVATSNGSQLKQGGVDLSDATFVDKKEGSYRREYLDLKSGESAKETVDVKKETFGFEDGSKVSIESATHATVNTKDVLTNDEKKCLDEATKRVSEGMKEQMLATGEEKCTIACAITLPSGKVVTLEITREESVTIDVRAKDLEQRYGLSTDKARNVAVVTTVDEETLGADAAKIAEEVICDAIEDLDPEKAKAFIAEIRVYAKTKPFLNRAVASADKIIAKKETIEKNAQAIADSILANLESYKKTDEAASKSDPKIELMRRALDSKNKEEARKSVEKRFEDEKECIDQIADARREEKKKLKEEKNRTMYGISA